MSTSKHIDRICIGAIAVTLILTLLFMNGASLGLTAAERTMGYEARLFDTSTVHTIDIVMDDWDSFIENCESEDYSSCTVLIDGEKIKNVGIRAKGNTSLSSVKSLGSERYSFKLEFDQYQTGKTYYGLDKLCLNNLIQDNTMMKDYLVYQMMAEYGVDAPLCSYTYITVNGEDWGLYLAVEGIEDSFLERNYGSEQGDLYKPDSLSFGGGRGNGRDFDMSQFENSNEDETASDGTGSDGAESDGAGSDETGSNSDSTESTGVDATASASKTNGSDNGNAFANGGSMPQSGEVFDFSNMPQPGEDFDFSNMPQPGEDFDFSNMPQPGEDFDISDIDLSNVFGGFGGMGSDDVKLKYIDDDPDSYSNIFDSAKTNVTSADQSRLIAALKNLTNYTDLENTLDMDEVLRYFVIHNFVINGDSYTGSMIHNYYLYEEDGKLSMIPWDYNLAYGTFQGTNASGVVNESIDNPVNGDIDDRPMVGWIFSDETYTEAYHELFAAFIEEWIDSGKLTDMIADTADLIRPYVEKDPSKFCTTEEFEAGVTAITQFVTLRGEAVSRQLSGDDTAVDTEGLNLSDMGTMNSGGGFGGGFGGGAGDAGNGTMPQMPGGSGEMPQMPGGSGDTSQMPQMPGGSGEMPQMPGGSGDTSQMPQMPGGSGEMPQMPDGSGETSEGNTETSMTTDEVSQTAQEPNGSGQMPQMPGGSGEMPQMPSGGQMPQMAGETGSGQMPQMPGGSGDTSQMPQMPGGGGQMPQMAGGVDVTSQATQSTESDDLTEETEGSAKQGFTAPTMQNGNQPNPGDFTAPGGTGTISTSFNWIWIGVSALILVLGILIAVIKRY